ncbi:hypothetical protein FIV42_13570 [Persicimonas caeni]|uniref:Uncharacterized protein n=1 Tax=Persicimonas caeni TaxID=2292766 RepID=A0A4Y6PUF0_PERCE|nr:hypothetical protein [Persicimonas caeni]QDG51739.1 hypothetical protein FIV42_13570 [Persicimonas caeni]QED32960.1 hypothetical protein FRD00_13565 [Persicimonas caeni]
MPYRPLTLLLIIATLTLAPGAAFAQDDAPSDEPRGPMGAAEGPDAQSSTAAGAWRASFGADATLTYFRRGDDAAVIVVAAGEHSEVELTADTLEGALRDSDAFHFVMNDDALADNSAVDDAKIVAKAKHLPVGQVAVVRVYAGAAGKPPTAVVTVYDKATGEAATALSVTRGAEPKPSDRPPADSAPAQTEETEKTDNASQQTEQGKQDAERAGADAAAGAVETAERAADPARRAYLARYVWFDEAGNEAPLSQWKRVYRGDQKESLEGEAFYREIGRPDLAEAYDTHSTIKWTTVAGLATLGAGSAAALLLTGEPGDETRLVTAGVVGGGLFVSSVFVGMLYNPHPIELDEAKQLAGEHNQEIRDELGLPEAAANEHASAWEWSVGVSPRGMSVRVGF